MGGFVDNSTILSTSDFLYYYYYTKSPPPHDDIEINDRACKLNKENLLSISKGGYPMGKPKSRRSFF